MKKPLNISPIFYDKSVNHNQFFSPFDERKLFQHKTDEKNLIYPLFFYDKSVESLNCEHSLSPA